MDIQQYWSVIQKRICPRCLDGDSSGECRLPVGEECALKSFLPEIVMTIANVNSDSHETYINALRRHVCILCDHQSSGLDCKKRDNLECALDRYYPLVIEIIDTVRAEMVRVEHRL